MCVFQTNNVKLCDLVTNRIQSSPTAAVRSESDSKRASGIFLLY